MNLKISGINKIISVSVSFTIALLIARVIYTRELTYAFYPWNIFLALIPLLAGRKLLQQKKFGAKAIACLSVWLLFFPNAPYLLTDIFHFKERAGCPAWFDLVLVSSASWTGIIAGILSLMDVEHFLAKHLQQKWVQLSILFFITLCGYGVYLGRFMRFNSWDIITDPIGLSIFIKNSFIHPHQNMSTWAFTIIFSFLFGIIFFTIKELNKKMTVSE